MTLPEACSHLKISAFVLSWEAGADAVFIQDNALWMSHTTSI